MARVELKRPVTIRLDGHRQRHFAPGVHDVPEEYAGHWYFRAHVKEHGRALAEEDESSEDPKQVDQSDGDKSTTTGDQDKSTNTGDKDKPGPKKGKGK